MMLKRWICAVALFCAVSLNIFGQAQFAGVYSGIIYITVGNNPESSAGAVLLSLNNAGEISASGLSGRVSSRGTITWDTPNALYLTTGSVAGGIITATGSNTENGTTITTRLEAKNSSAALPPTADPVLDSFVWVNPSPFAAIMQGAIYQSNQFLAVGSGGLVATSTDGLSWSPQVTPSRRNMKGATFGKGLYVAVGESETIMTSPNGQTWTLRNTPSAVKFDLASVAFGNNRFLAVGGVGNTLYSDDGVVWTSRTGTGIAHLDVKFLNGKFVIVGALGLGGISISTSLDGAAWNPAVTLASVVPIRGIAFANSKYLVCGTASDGKSRIFQSTDAVSWTMNPNIIAEGITNGIKFTYVTSENGKYIAFDGNNFSYISSDGVTWQRGKTVLREPKAVVFGGGQYVAVGNTLSRSVDGVLWTDQVTRRQSPHLNYVGPNAYVGQGGFFDRFGLNNIGLGVTNDLYWGTALGNYTGDGGFLRYSGFDYVVPGRERLRGLFQEEVATDPTTHVFGDAGAIYAIKSTTVFTNSTAITVVTNIIRRPTPTTSDLLGEMVFNNTRFVFGRNGTILRTTNLFYTNWVALPSGVTADLYSGGRPFIAEALAVIVGDQGTILTSSNGLSWTKRNSGTTEKLIHFSYQEKSIFDKTRIYTAVSENGTILTSLDHGTNWSIVASNSFGGKLRSVSAGFAASPGLIAVGDYGLVASSDDRTNWVQRVIDANFSSAVYGNGRWVVVGPFYCLVSVDGVRWEFHSFKYGQATLAYGGGRFVAVTVAGIISSPDAINWTDAYKGTGIGGAAFGNGRWIAPTATNLLVSSDGLTWTAGAASTAGAVTRMHYANGTWVGVGFAGNRPYSTNGFNWTANVVNQNDVWRGITYGKGLWVSVGSSGKLSTSTNGMAWTARNVDTSFQLNDVELVGDRFIAIGKASTTNIALISTNGTNWTSLGLPLPLAFNGEPAINGLLAVNGTLLAVGINGTILQSSYPVTGLPAVSVSPSTNVSASAGTVVSFKAMVSGTAPLQFQWFHNGVPLVNKSRVSGATSDTLTLTLNAAEDGGEYTVEVMNAVGSRTSYPVTLTVAAPPTFLSQPTSQTVTVGGRASFSASASGGAVGYQWFRNGQIMAGQTNSTLALENLQASDAAAFTVVATNANGGRTSSAATLSVSAAPSYSVDPSFLGSSLVFSNWAGYQNSIWSILPLPNGKRLIGGTFKIIKGASVYTGIARLNADGSIDTTFTPPTLQPAPNVYFFPAVRAIQPLVDGRFLLGGETTLFNPTRGMVLIGADGALEANQPAIVLQQPALGTHMNAFARQADGKILMAGSFVLNGLYHFGRLNTNLTVDSTFGSSTIRLLGTEGYAIGLQPDQRIVVAGPGVIRVQTNGFSDLNFSRNTPAGLQNMVVFPDGRIAVGGVFVSGTHTNIAMLDVNGAVVDSFQANTDANVYAMTRLPDDSLAVGGYFTRINGVATGNAGLVRPDGTVASNFKVDLAGAGPIYSIAADNDGSVLIGGVFKSVNGTPATNFARLVVQAANAPLAIARQPQGVAADIGDAVTLNVAASGGAPLNFQWRKNGVTIPGASKSFLTLTAVTTNDVANYTVVVTDPSGSQTSEAAPVTVGGIGPQVETGSFTDWAVSSGLPVNARGAGDDPDGDGMPNIFEYYLGANPVSATSEGSISGALIKSGGQNYPALSFIRSKAARSVTAEVQVSSKVTFSDSLGAVQESVVDLGSGLEQVTYRSTVNDRTQAFQFLRLRLSL